VKLFEHIKQTSTADLFVLLEFFEHERLRAYFTGLIADVRAELAERGEDWLAERPKP
jgi:hypothetical protein